MMDFDALRAITRRAIPVNYISPLICQNEVPFSASGTDDISSLDILPILQEDGPVAELTQPSATENRISWTEVPGAYSYAVYRATSEAGPFSLVVAGLLEVFFVDEPGSSGTYYYKVTAVEPNFGETKASNVVIGIIV